MSDNEFRAMRWSDPIVIPSKAMRPGEQVTVTNQAGEVLHRFTASIVPKQACRVEVGDRVEYVDAAGRHVQGTVFHADVDPVSGLDVVSLEEEQ